MSIVALKWAVGQRLRHRDKCVLMVLAWHANSKTQRCDPSLRTIAAEAGMSRNTLDDALDELHRLGLIETKTPGRRDAATRYTLNLDSDIIDTCGSDARPRRVAQPVNHDRGSTGEPSGGSVSGAGVAQPVSQKGRKNPNQSVQGGKPQGSPRKNTDAIRLKIVGGRHV